MFEVAIVGTGADPDDPDREGYAMAYRHAPGYESHPECSIVACADIVRENAVQFAERFDVPAVYESTSAMLTEQRPDVVSVCVPPRAHAGVVEELAQSGRVDAIHCEKPMATTWSDCREMVEVCERNGVQLTINHQMRFGRPFSAAKSLLDDGEIGELKRLEFAEADLYDAGTHAFDLCGFYTDDEPVEWVIAQIDYREENVWFGSHNENQAIAQWRYADGTHGLAATGRGEDFVGCYLRLSGTSGTIEVRDEDDPLWLRRDGSGWRPVDTGVDHIYGPRPGLVRAGVRRTVEALPVGSADAVSPPRYTTRAIHEVVDALAAGRESELGGRRALRGTELIFASWESARSRRRVDLPLDIDDNPLESMVDAGKLPVDANSG